MPIKNQMTRRRRSVTALFALVVAVTASATPAGATFPGRNGKLVVQRFDYPRDNLYLIDPDGSDAARVSHGVGSDIAASFSADGRSIVFYRSREQGAGLYLVNADGTQQRRVPNTGPGYVPPSFAPDGRTVAFGNQGIFTIRIDGTHQRVVDGDPFSRRPVYSADGRSIAFTRRTSGTATERPYLVRADRTVRRLANAGSALSFSPDSRRLLLAREGDIYVLVLKGHRLRRLTNGKFDDTDAVFSPNGRQIAFVRHESAETGDSSQVGVYVMRADGTQKHRILAESTAALDWQPLGGDQLWRPFG